MSVYIPGMEMPESCGKCYMFSFLSDSCRLTNHVTEEMNDKMFDRRFEDCPLIPVPDHGRLIDADALRSKQQEDADLFKGLSNYAEKVRYDEAINLKRCPFCGSSDVHMVQVREPLPDFEDTDSGDWIVRCLGCKSDHIFYHALKNGADAWNGRTKYDGN